jgi:hypothetical protein
MRNLKPRCYCACTVVGGVERPSPRPPKFHIPYYTRSSTTLPQEGSSHTYFFLFPSHSHGSLTYALVTRTDISHPQKSRIYPVHPHYSYNKRHISPSLPPHSELYIPSTHPSWPLSWIATDTGHVVLFLSGRTSYPYYVSHTRHAGGGLLHK